MSLKGFIYINFIDLLGSDKLKLVNAVKEVMIVPVKPWAFSKAIEERVYTCPTRYGARDVAYLAFYRVSPISAITHIARVSKTRDKVPFDEVYGSERVPIRKYGEIVKVYYLERIKELPRPIVKGKAAPIRHFRYAILTEIMKAKDLGDLRKV